MATEFAGAIEIDPPLTSAELGYVRRLAEGGPPGSLPWAASRDGTRLRARREGDIATALASLRLLVGTTDRPRRFRGTVAAYDGDTGDLVAITVAGGRVTLRSLRAGVRRSNVIDLAARRRTLSRAIG
jgi:hypothetical protein